MNKDSLKSAFSILGIYKKYMAISLIMSAVYVAITLYIPILVGNAIDLIKGENQVDMGGIVKIIALIAASTLFVGVLQWIMNIVNNKISFEIVNDLRTRAFDNILKLPVKYLDTHRSGDIVSRIIADAEQVADGLLMGFAQLFTGVATIVGTLVIMIVLKFQIAMAVVVLTPLSLFAARFISRKTFDMFVKQSEIRGEQTAFINEMLPNQKIVKAFSHESENEEIFNEINGRLKNASFKATFFSSLVNPATRVVNSIVYAAVGLLGALYAIGGAITVGGLSCFLNYANQYTKPFNEISGVITELQNATACAERIFELIKLPCETDSVHAISPDSVDGNVAAKNVDFSYTPQKPLIKNLNFDIPCGSKVALVGPTGCGKTTIINLLMRFYDPVSGNITVDGNDIKDLNRHSLRRAYGMVLQETWLKNGTIKENIAFAKPDACDEEIIAAAKKAHCHNFIMRMPNGYDTVVKNGGEGLSQGQKQLLCIARIMLSMPPMLILDEATSSIDTRTELKIQDAFSALTKGKTSFIVAHRLSTVKDADIIFVMKDGNVIEQGTHKELIAEHGFYYKIYNSQFVK